jgi:hypothetical protein
MPRQDTLLLGIGKRASFNRPPGVTGPGCRGEVCVRTQPPDVCSCRLQS